MTRIIKYLFIYAGKFREFFFGLQRYMTDIFCFVLQVWFQNRRAKWKKRKKTTNVFRSSGSLLPSHGLPPFGPMSSDLCSGMFHTPADRWGMGTGQISIVTFITNRVQEMRGKKKKRLSVRAYIRSGQETLFWSLVLLLVTKNRSIHYFPNV